MQIVNCKLRIGPRLLILGLVLLAPGSSLLAPAWAVTLYELGCVPDDPTFDNAAAIELALEEGRITEPIICPGGAWFFPRVCDLGNKAALKFIGSGACDWKFEEGAFQDNREGNVACRFIGKRIFRLHSFGPVFEGINFHNGYKTKDPDWDDSVAVEYSCAEDGPPSGKAAFNHCSFAGYERALWFRKSNHVDNVTGTWLRFQDCAHGIYCDENQANGFFFGEVVCIGRSRCLFDFQAGGMMTVGVLKILSPTLILRANNVGANTCAFTFWMIKVDNNAGQRVDENTGQVTRPGWRLVEADGPLVLTARGLIGKRAEPGENPIVLTKPADETRLDFQFLDVRLWRDGRFWPAASSAERPEDLQ